MWLGVTVAVGWLGVTAGGAVVGGRADRWSAALRADGSALAQPVHGLDQHAHVFGVHVRGHAVAQVEYVAFAGAAVAVGVAVEHAAGGAFDGRGVAVQGGGVQVALQGNTAAGAGERVGDRKSVV